ncbi:MAG TPA: phosphatase PAP2 family protein [Acidobacteriaceae bacterium]|nr:phosphatase PAP2 family protein [Acidobacteriaceae bacterium]
MRSVPPRSIAAFLLLRQAALAEALLLPVLLFAMERERSPKPRPFVASTQVHPVCEKTASTSYPSGHSMVGTLEALALAQMIPERSPRILHRLDQYMQNRIVCGVHYPSDVVASRIVASSLFGLVAASPAFQKQLASARAEVRNHLGLPESSTRPTVDRTVSQTTPSCNDLASPSPTDSPR